MQIFYYHQILSKNSVDNENFRIIFSLSFVFVLISRFEFYKTMGLTYCKSLCSSSKTPHSINNGNGQAYSQPAVAQTTTVAADYNLSTLQNAVENAAAIEGVENYVTCVR